MKSVKSGVAKWYFIAMGAALALAPTLVAFAGGSATD